MARGIEASLQDKFIKKLKDWNIQIIKTKGGISYLPTGKVQNLGNGLYSGIFRIIKEPEGFADVIIFTNEILKLATPPSNLDYEFRSIGKTYFIELKTDIGKLRDSQIEKFNKLKKLGFDCFILRPKHWEQAKLKGKLSFENLLEEMEEY